MPQDVGEGEDPGLRVEVVEGGHAGLGPEVRGLKLDLLDDVVPQVAGGRDQEVDHGLRRYDIPVLGPPSHSATASAAPR